MLDMSVRAKILQLMLNLKREFGFTYLYITHDLATAKFFCDRIAILYLGRIVEIGTVGGDLRGSEASVHEGAPEGDSGARPDVGACRATCRAARFPTRRGRRSDARSTRAVPARSRSAAGRVATCEICSRRVGRGMPEEAVRGRAGSAREPGAARRLVDVVSARGLGRSAPAPTSWRSWSRIRADDPEEPFWRGVREYPPWRRARRRRAQRAVRAAASTGRAAFRSSATSTTRRRWRAVEASPVDACSTKSRPKAALRRSRLATVVRLRGRRGHAGPRGASAPGPRAGGRARA